MTTFNTGNPIGSTDARDLSDNAENLDIALGTTASTWVDRLGVTRDSFEGRLEKGSFYRVGTFSVGYTLTNMRQTLEYSGHEYSWAGTFPKVVAAGSTPETAGGIGAGAWVDRTDVTLRSELSQLTGSGQIGFSKSYNYQADTVGKYINDVINYSTPEAFGIYPGSTVYSSELDLMFFNGGEIRFETPGVYLTDHTLILKSNTKLYIGSGVTIKLAPGSNCPIFKNFAYANSTANDSYIEITGSGTIDYDYSNQSASGLNTMASILKAIDVLKIGGGLKVINAAKYAWLVCKVDKLTADGLIFDTHSDGLHCQSPISNAYIRNLYGTTGDDMLAFTSGDYSNYYISEAGGFSNVDVSGIFSSGSLCALKVTGNSTGTFYNFKVSGIYGSTTNPVVRIWGDANLTHTIIKRISIEDIYAIPAGGMSTIEINDRGFIDVGQTYGIEIDTIKIKNVNSANTTAQTVSISGSAGTIVREISVSGLPRDALTVVGVNNTTVTVHDMHISNGNLQFVDNANASVVRNSGTISRLYIKDVSAIFQNSTNGNIVRLNGGCTLSFAKISDVYQKNGACAWYQISALYNKPYVELENFTIDAGGRITQNTSSDLEVSLSNCRAVGIGSANMFFSRAGGLTLSGNIVNGVDNVITDNGGAVTMPVGSHNIPCDISKITSKNGLMLYNTNSGLSCGLGLVVCNASKVWKNIYSNSTYTSAL